MRSIVSLTFITKDGYLLPVIWVIFHDDHTSRLSFGNEFFPALSACASCTLELHLLVSLVVDGDDPAFSDSHGDITISHGKGVVASL
jgi:hypothetical protein